MKLTPSFFLSLGAFIVSLTTLLLVSKQEERPDAYLSEADLLDRVEELESELAQVSGFRPKAFETQRVERVTSQGVSRLNPEAGAAINAVEKPQDQINGEVESMRWTMALRGMMQPTADHLKRAEGIIFANNSTIGEKLAMFKMLSRNGGHSDELVMRMTEVYRFSSNSNDKLNILRALDSSQTPELVEFLITESSSNENSRIRQQAIDNLSPFLPDPDLMEWIEVVSQSDPESRVRNEANRLIKKFGNIGK